jgi:GNAT superfamily N-acetyltransferase
MHTIKKATLAELETLSYLFDWYRVFYEYPSDLEGASAFLKARIMNSDSEIFIANAEDGTMTGFVQLYPLFSSTRMKRLWLLNDLFVLPGYRGQGVSKGLIERAKELCRTTSAAGLILETAKSNTIGNKLYPTTGFKLDTDHNYYYWES